MKIVSSGDVKVKVVSKPKKKQKGPSDDESEMVNRGPPIHLCGCLSGC